VVGTCKTSSVNVADVRVNPLIVLKTFTNNAALTREMDARHLRFPRELLLRLAVGGLGRMT